MSQLLLLLRPLRHHRAALPRAALLQRSPVNPTPHLMHRTISVVCSFKRSLEKPKRPLDVFKYDLLKNAMGGTVLSLPPQLLLLMMATMVML